MPNGYQLIRELTTENDDNTIRVRLIRMWDAINRNTKLTISRNLILLDEKDDDIHVTLRVNQFDQFNSKLHVGDTYFISNVKVLPAADSYKPVPGNKALNFQRNTIVKKTTDDIGIPAYKFHCLPFDQAKTRAGNIVNLIDVAGRLIEFTELQTTTNGSEKMEILLENQWSETIKITLWEDKAKTFIAEDSTYKNSNTYVIVTGTLAKNIGRQFLLSSTSSTQFYFNIKHPTVMDLKNRQPGREATNDIPKFVPFVQAGGQDISKDAKDMTIAELFDAKLDDNITQILCSVKGTITGIIPNFGWFYTACKNCHKKMQMSGTSGSKKCLHCPNQPTTTTYAYMVIMNVKDSTGSATFVMFDKQAKSLIGVPVQHILDTDEEASPYKIPIVVNNIIGKDCIFQLKLTAHSLDYGKEQFTITKVTELKSQEATDPKPFNHEENHQAASTSTETTRKRNAEESVDSDSLHKTNAGTITHKNKQRKLNDENHHTNNQGDKE
ncbi:hypothetical protein POM88_033613 [Heracleum sosnowskyi]|uniref:Replication protein A subunit n=1 Tax=Heracleum sosnowskyi TaxID=360622 RepID=A0AAD8HHU5_9APIA|nr:hypothetical protein POM88_033613 [Heracleum sosnowskyi]